MNKVPLKENKTSLEKKLKEVLTLLERPEKFKTRDEALKYQLSVEKALDIYKKLSFDFTLTADEKLKVLVSFIENIPDEGLDMLARYRDMIKFLKGKDLDCLINVLIKVTRSPAIHSGQRLLTAVCLYNNGYIDVCYPCFADMAFDNTMMLDDRVSCCRYMFASEDDTQKEMAQECLINIIDTNAYPSDYRYKIIAAYIMKTGFALALNMTKIRIPYDEEFVYGMQSVFFYNEKNGVRERILSGQHILQMSCVDEKEKIEICDKLLAIAYDKTCEENVRADAADVVLRLGIGDQIIKARQSIMEMGTAVVNTDSTSLFSRAKTIYSNSQNIHDEKISECIIKFIEKFSKETHVRLRPFIEVHQEVADLIRSFSLPPPKRFAALKALNRISVDTATFTQYRTTIAEIFIHVWIRLCMYEENKRKELEKFLVDELIDMGETCSSGHAGRLVNVLASEDSSLRISFESQIVANVAGRVNARIKAADKALKDVLLMGMMEDADKEDADKYKEFLSSIKQSLYSEMKKEFVDGGYVTQRDFDKYFEKGFSSLMRVKD